MAQPTPQTIWTVGSLLQWTTDFFARKDIDAPRLSAELLLSHALSCDRMRLYTQFEKVPTEPQIAAFRALVKSRGEGVPVQYLIGKASFYGLDFIVNPAVLIPRPDTETLVEQIITKVRGTPGYESPLILDLCTGSGAIAVTLAKNLPAAKIYATDLSPAALAVAQENAEKNKVADRMEFLEGDLWAAAEKMQPLAQFHVIASNPPYISTTEVEKLQREVKEHEPRMALEGGLDGLDFLRQIVAGAPSWLVAGGTLAVEHGFDQSKEVVELFATSGFGEIRPVRDAGQNWRCVVGVKR